MAQLKAVVFSLRNVFFNDDNKQFDEQQILRLINLIKHLDQKGIRIILHSNDKWFFNRANGITIADHLCGLTNIHVSYYNKVDYPQMPAKPRADAIPFILVHENLKNNEIIYVGFNDNDWQACVNAKILFIKANWIKPNYIQYGFSFDDIAALARFIDICCIDANKTLLISYKDKDLEFYTLSPFSTYKPQLQAYSASARSTAKQITAAAEPDFWLMLLIAKIYFSGLYLEINAIVAFPGHQPGYGNSVMDAALDIFAKCFRISYYHDALIRHKTSIKSQTARNNGNSNLLGIYNHLNTIYLNRNPSKYDTNKPLKHPPYRAKKVLLIDDIATAGFSLDAAKLLLQRAGASVICLSWLKTINTDMYVSQQSLPAAYPIYQIVTNAQSLYPAPNPKMIPYSSIINSFHAGYDMTTLFNNFRNWDVKI